MHVKICLTPKQSEFDRKVETTKQTLFGGARGGGKSRGLREILIKRRLQYANSIGYIFRKTFSELEANHISRIFIEHPELEPYYHSGNKTIRFPNGSELRFAYLEHKKDLRKFQGREIHDLGIEEAGEWEYDHYEYLLGSNRSSVPGIEPRVLLTANPGGIGHRWLKRLFVERRYEKGEKPEDYAFVAARVEDNPALMEADPEYVLKLEAMKNEMLRRAYRYGDWDIAAGQYFSEFRREAHVIKPLPLEKNQPYPVPTHWPRFGGYDFGFNHPSAIYWMATDGDGNIYVYREHVEPRLRIDEQAKIINSYPDSNGIIFHAGRDCWGQKFVAKEGMPPTIAEEFATHHVYLRPANIDRKQGAARIRELLAVRNVGGKTVGPRVFIFDTCPVLIDTLQKLTHDPDDTEDVLKIDADENDPTSGDDAYDSFRYGIMSRPWKALPGKRPWKDRYDDERPSRPSWQTI